MKNRIFVIGLAIGMLTVFVPATTASHFSVGTVEEGTVGPEEGPRDGAGDWVSVPGERAWSSDDPDDPTKVEGATDSNDNELPYYLGTKNSSQCYDAKTSVDIDLGDPQDPQVTVTDDTDRIDEGVFDHHAFCGTLLYNEDTTYEVPSPPDQTYHDRSFVDRFDVQRTYYVGNLGIGLCEPFCKEDTPRLSEGGERVGKFAWDAVHDVGDFAGLTEDGDTADQHNEGDRDQSYELQATIMGPGPLAQNQTDRAWQMNGFTLPYVLEHWVAHVLGNGYDVPGTVDETGAPVDESAEYGTVTEQQLRHYVQDKADASDGLDSDTSPQICGYIPSRVFTSTGEQDLCGRTFLWGGSNESAENHDENRPFASYNDRCKSPGYVCDPANDGEFWSSFNVGIAAYGTGTPADYAAWHFIIAPHEHECAGAQTTFSLSNGDGDMPFVAHDLDVYVPRTATSGGDHIETVHFWDHVNATPITIPGISSLDPDLGPLNRTEILEPNYVNASNNSQPFTDLAIDDNSRQALEQEVDLTHPCDKLLDDETDDTRDPWVNYIDTGVETNRETGFYSGTTGGLSGGVGPYGLYGLSDDGSQDEDNDPTTDLYSTQGFVGVMADRDDDGEYDQLTGPDDSTDTFGEPGGEYASDNIQEQGAYPMLWDMWANVTEEGDFRINTDEGDSCSGPGGDPIAEVMKEANYGANTGLVQAIYLQEETVFTDLFVETDDPKVAEFQDGNNIYVFLNNATKVAWDEDVDTDNGLTLDGEVDTFLETYRSHLVDDLGVSPAPDIVPIGNQSYLDQDMDFQGQCGESTGGYEIDASFTHSCELGCQHDTVATMYTYEVTDENGTLGGGSIPTLTIGGEDFDFTTDNENVTSQTWYDVDPFDGNEERNAQRLDAPPEAED